MPDQFYYEFRNQHTRGWIESSFDLHELPVTWEAAVELTKKYKARWLAGTEVRAVDVSGDKPKFSEPL